MINMERTGRAIAEAREKASMTQKQLAEQKQTCAALMNSSAPGLIRELNLLSVQRMLFIGFLAQP